MTQCKARRKPGLWEYIRYWLWGPACGFDPKYETQCYFYEGHEAFGHDNPRQAKHEDITGYRW